MAKIRIYKFTLCFLYYSNAVINKNTVSKLYVPVFVIVKPLISYETIGIKGFQNACK